MDIRPLVQGFNSEETHNFFLWALTQKTKNDPPPADQIDYVSDMLAGFAKTPPHRYPALPPYATMGEVIAHFAPKEFEIGRDLLLYAGDHSLFLSGFFREYYIGRVYSLESCEQVGSRFYRKAAHLSVSPGLRRTLYGLANDFGSWATTLSRLSADFRRRVHRPLVS